MSHCGVIGGAGFLGRPLVDQLVASGRTVVVIDRQPYIPAASGGNEVINRIGDYSDKNFLANALRDVSEIVLLAYASVPKTSYEDPLSDMTNNLPPVLGLLEIAATLSLKKVLIVSSGGAVYGRVDQLPILETHPTNPLSPYGITKLAIEKYAGMYRATKKVPVVIARPANAYGEGQRPYTGQGFIATAIASVLDGKMIIVFGDNGTIRDYIHVEDIARGLIAILDRGKVGEQYNLGTGVGMSNEDILAAIRVHSDQQGHSINVKHLPAREFDVPANVLDIQKIKNDTGWVPSIAFSDGLARAWRWFEKYYSA